MVGIVSYGAYIPYYRLKKETAAAAFGKRAGRGAKAVAYCDEDSITMAVGAAMDAATAEKDSLGAVYFASTSCPYREKMAATEIAAALDLPLSVRTADFSGSLRAGSAAMLSAADLLNARGGKALVTMSDCRLGAADGKFETELGDSAAAMVLGTEDLFAELEDSVSISRAAFDEWQSENERYLHDWDVRFANMQIYTPLVQEAVTQLLSHMGLQSADYRFVALYGHTDKLRNGLAAKLGFTPEQLTPSMFDRIGNTGNAAAGLMLCDAFDRAKPGDRVLYVSYGEGVDVLSFRVKEKAATCRPVRTVEQLLERQNEELPYGKYLKWKKMLMTEPQKRPAQERSSVPDYYRNFKKNHSLWGVRCKECGLPVFPPQRMCVHCHAIDRMEPYCFLDKKAKIRTFTMDGLSLSLDSPNILVVLEFEGGGKMMTYLVDCKKDDVRVGMAVRPTFRKMFEANGMQTYFWKVVPDKEGEQ